MDNRLSVRIQQYPDEIAKMQDSLQDILNKISLSTEAGDDIGDIVLGYEISGRGRGTPEEIIGGNAVIIRDAHEKIETALTLALLVMGKKSLRNTEIGCGGLLAYMSLFTEQG